MATKVDAGPSYILGLFETQVILGRVSWINKKRAEQLMQQLRGPARERLETWGSGSRDHLLGLFGDQIAGEHFDDADEAYARNPKAQVRFDRMDA